MVTPQVAPAGTRVALVCSNYTMQSAFALMFVALNSVRLGYETMIYFTFEGLKMLEPGGMERIRYYPTGVQPEAREVGRYNAELREKMDAKDIPYVEDMFEMAQLEGVRMLACKTSADLFDLTQGDFVEGVEVMLAEDFMKQATGANLNLVFCRSGDSGAVPRADLESEGERQGVEPGAVVSVIGALRGLVADPSRGRSVGGVRLRG